MPTKKAKYFGTTKTPISHGFYYDQKLFRDRNDLSTKTGQGVVPEEVQKMREAEKKGNTRPAMKRTKMQMVNDALEKDKDVSKLNALASKRKEMSTRQRIAGIYRENYMDAKRYAQEEERVNRGKKNAEKRKKKW